MSRLGTLRMEKGLTQEMIASYAGIAVSTYSQYENGLRTVPRKTAESIATIIGCSIDEIFLPQKFTVSKTDGREANDSEAPPGRDGA